ncbi:Eco57I restriction-modification methylase domain-containing protein [Candidatus Poriferisocius sp.]|uniref:Eco57I restriction-modification methylase domain-containing protein n=1 Tax=Candidatus Poriferisocius sp. TaxID=3101276 RepID=UPI003B5B8FBF
MGREAVSVLGALLSRELLERVDNVDPKLPGMKAVDYGLAPGERIRDAITRSWQRLTALWVGFRQAEESLALDETGTSLTRERWLLPLLDELGFAGLPLVQSLNVKEVSSGGTAGKDYAISHEWAGYVPVHLMGWRVDVDKRSSGVRGASKASPHGLVQEFLNHSDDHLWGIVSNGRMLRLLRDNASFTRQAYVEFDVAAIFDGDSFAEFALLWLCCHRTRLEAEQPHRCLLEQWSQEAASAGTRARDKLRDGVESAIVALGCGVLEHPTNQALRARLRNQELVPEVLQRQLLRIVYRLLFLLVAEARGLLHPADADPEAKQRYEHHYSVARLRRLAERRRGGDHSDLWAGLAVTMAALDIGDNEGQQNARTALGLTSLGSFLWSSAQVPDLADAKIGNARLLEAIRNLALVRDDEARLWRQVDYRNLGTEELGSVYESLLELHPETNPDARTFELKRAAGSERKTTGSYYTPPALISRLLDDALDPVIDEAAAQPDPEQALLALKVLDPACGSGHFLIAAGHRIATRLARVREGGTEPSADKLRSALREVVGRCLYGIDINPMAVELCKVSLWLEANVPGSPLGFLEHRIACGNSLLGTNPKLLAEGVPDAAFKALTGDDRKHVSALRKRNKAERKARGQLILELDYSIAADSAKLAAALRRVDEAPEQTAEQVTNKEVEYAEVRGGGLAQKEKLIADTWCAAFVAPKTSETPAITDEVLREAERLTPDQVLAMNYSDNQSRGSPLDIRVLEAIRTLADDYQFTHMHLTFPEVFSVPSNPDDATNPQTGWSGGFDAVLGNPPWGRVKLKRLEWFAARDSHVAMAESAAARNRRIEVLKEEDPALHTAFELDYRKSEDWSSLLCNSGSFPLAGRGDVNTYSVFAELMRVSLSPHGRLGVIVPSGIATDDTTKYLFRDLVETGTLVSLYDFENRGNIFPAVDSRYRFCLLTLTGVERTVDQALFSFFAHEIADLDDVERIFELDSDDFSILNPNTKTCPIFRTRRDAELTKQLYHRLPSLLIDGDPDGNPWYMTYQCMFHMGNDADLFRDREGLERDGWALDGNHFVRSLNDHACEYFMPLYEGKMATFYDHRAAHVVKSPTATRRKSQPRYLNSEEKLDPCKVPIPLSWVSESHVKERVGENPGWLLGLNDITSATNERTMVCSALPVVAVGHSEPLIWTPNQPHLLLASLCSFAFDYVARQKVGGTHMTWTNLKQLPALPLGVLDDHADCITQAVLELTYTAWDMEAFAMSVGYDGPPFLWDLDRRSLIRAELDALMFHLYGVNRDDTAYMMNNFRIVKRKDVEQFGKFQTKDLILDRYDAMTQAYEAAYGALSDTPNSTTPPLDLASLSRYSNDLAKALSTHYQTNINPPPAHPSLAHPASTRPSWTDRD